MSHVFIVRDPADTVAHAGPINWAISQLREALVAKGVACDESAGRGGLHVVVATPSAAMAREMLQSAGVSLPDAAEALAVVPGKHDAEPAILACGADVRGLAVVLSQDGFGPNRVRDVNPSAEQWRLGGGPDDTNHTRIIDVAWDGKPTQEDMLSKDKPSKETNMDNVKDDDFAQLMMARVK